MRCLRLGQAPRCFVVRCTNAGAHLILRGEQALRDRRRCCSADPRVMPLAPVFRQVWVSQWLWARCVLTEHVPRFPSFFFRLLAVGPGGSEICDWSGVSFPGNGSEH
mmetsp:Transcript_56738/g.151364  ORF Transcript_56738/g.151364 Transcript_56738/m.151364 type:complete len:107 (+) Transcript_56738:1342-1662(+)